MQRPILLLLAAAALIRPAQTFSQEKFASHPPARPMPRAVERPLAEGLTRYVDQNRGDDGNPGTESQPWKTLTHAVSKLAAGETIVARGGVYYERLTVTTRGTADKPVTIRSFPGELAVINGGIPEFLLEPETAWEPLADGEFRSVRKFPDLGEKDGTTWLLGNFADSMTPLHGYRFRSDLLSKNEYFAAFEGSKAEAGNGIYSGPGIWYDVETGHIHARLAPTTQLALGKNNYAGESDPRKIPLIIAGGHTSPINLDGAAFITLQDLVAAGSRQATINVTDCSNITLDNVTAYGGSSALRVEGTSGLRCVNCAFRGIAAPWTWRGSLKYRAIEARIVSASSWNPPARPNRDFEFAYCEFTDCVDGVFLGNVEGVKVHHCLLDHISDDGFFVTCRAGYDGKTRGGDVHIYQNLLSRCLTTFAFGVGHGRQRTIGENNAKQLGEGVWITRNVFDFRKPVHYQQPAEGEPEIITYGRTTGDHGSPAWEPMFVYHNTFIQAISPWRNYYGAGFAKSMGKGSKRRIFNNIFYHLRGMPGDLLPDQAVDFAADGNRHWSAELETEGSATFLKKNQTPWATNDVYGDPNFAEVPEDGDLDLRSPDAGGGVAIPDDWLDPLRPANPGETGGVGMLPTGLSPDAWRVGIHGRFNALGHGRPDLSLPTIRTAISSFHFPVMPSPSRRAAIMMGYPAFSAPMVRFALEKAGFEVALYDKTWLPVSGYADYEIIVVTGDLQRAKMEPFSYSNQDHGKVVNYLEKGGALVMMRGAAGQLWAGDTGKRKLHALTGAVSHKSYQPEIREPEHPWLRHLDKEAGYSWLSSKAVTPIGMTRGENLIGDQHGKSQLGSVKVGKGQLIHIGWPMGNYIPQGRKPSTVAEEEAYEAQYEILEAIIRGFWK